MSVRGFRRYTDIVSGSGSRFQHKNIVGAVDSHIRPLLRSGFFILHRERIGGFTVFGKTAHLDLLAQLNGVNIELRGIRERLLHYKGHVLAGNFTGCILDRHTNFIVHSGFGSDFNRCIGLVALCSRPFGRAGLAIVNGVGIGGGAFLCRTVNGNALAKNHAVSGKGRFVGQRESNSFERNVVVLCVGFRIAACFALDSQLGGASVKRPIPDTRHAVWYRDLCVVSIVIIQYIFNNNKPFSIDKTFATGKRIIPDTRHAVGDRDRGQA